MDARPVKLTYALGDIVLFRKQFRLLTHNHGLADGHDPVDLDVLWQKVPGDCAGLLVRSCPAEGTLPVAERRGETLRYAANQYDHYFADLQGTFENYLQTFSSKSRSTLRRKVRKFAESSGRDPCYRVFREPAEMPAFWDDARRVSARSYQTRLLDAGLPEDETFLLKMTDLAAAGNVRGYMLYHGEQPVAYLYCPIRDGVVHYAYLGFDPEFRQSSPGTVLQYHAMESLFTEGGHRMFDFDLGEGEHKRLFSTGSVHCADVYCLRATLGNRFWVRLHRMVNGLSSGLGGLLKKLRLKAAVKRFLRRG